MKVNSKKIKLWLITLACALLVLPVLVVLMVRIEKEAPLVKIDLSSVHFGAKRDLVIEISDEKSGLKKIWVGIFKDGRETDLFVQEYPASGWLRKGDRDQATARVSVEPKALDLTDGAGILRMVVTDHSWSDWGKGNRTYVEKEIQIDTKPPAIEVLTNAHNISPGGAGLVLYTLSEPCRSSGVTVGEEFYPGHPAGMADKTVQLALFALAHDQGKGTRIALRAEDRAGNRAVAGFYHHIKKHVFRKDTIRISDGFLNAKMPEFESLLAGQDSKTPLERFLYVNRELREQNKQRIDKACASSDSQFYWEGVFIRLPGSATRSQFADRRTYTYKGAAIDKQIHLGIDLASNARSPIPAANRGRVAFADYLGIYGNAVIIDHGFGLFSMYAHLSSIGVETDRIVAKGEIIGRTGKSGLAGGDHLHFSMLVHNTFVTPLEWWDPNWIKNNITNKIDSVLTE